MPKYAVDPEGVEYVATSLRLAAQHAPDGALADAYGCGSATVERAVDDANAEFSRAWRQAFEALDSRTAGAVEAALRYRDNENRVYSAAERQRG